MRVFRRSKFQRHLVIPLMLVCFLAGCSSWRVQPAPATSHEAPERARITLSDGRVVELRSLEVRGDSVVGVAKTGSNAYAVHYALQAYPLADVTKFEVPKDNTRMIVAITAGVLIVGVVLFVTLSDFCVKVLLEDCAE